jgi:hypothetical protein
MTKRFRDNGMPDLVDPESLKQLREVADSIPPQLSPRAAKALDEFKKAVKRLEAARKAKPR